MILINCNKDFIYFYVMHHIPLKSFFFKDNLSALIPPRSSSEVYNELTLNTHTTCAYLENK